MTTLYSSTPRTLLLAGVSLLAVEIASPQARAADLEPFVKAPAVIRGEFKAWVEGGAIWTGGDPVYTFYPSGGIVAPNLPGFFALTPKVGWEAATGFDYRFAGTQWHVSAQFRYGEAKTSDSAAAALSLVIPPVSLSESQAVTASHKETHWLADFAVGRDLGIGNDAIQVKGGLRIAEITANTNTLSNTRTMYTGITPRHRRSAAAPRPALPQ
jgi:hypothetical protein